MPGGVITPPPPRAEKALRALLPEVDYSLIVGIATTYQIEAQHKSEAPASVRKTMQSIAEHAAALYVSIATLSEESRHQLFDALRPVGDVGAFVATVEHASQLLIGVARNAALDVDTVSNRPANAPRRTLVRQLARLLQRYGHAADARESGLLCQVVGTILEGYGEYVAEVRSVVRPALVESL